MYPARDIIIALNRRGLSDTAISTAIGCSRETIYRIRGQKGHYSGKIIYRRLVSLANACNIVTARQSPPRQPAPGPAPARRVSDEWEPQTRLPTTLTGQLQRMLAEQQARQQQMASVSAQIQKPATPAAAMQRTVRNGPTVTYQQVRCLQCPSQPPAGLKPAEFSQWIQEHPCKQRMRGECPK
jgi:hypothetical protein